jgi:hypothetical protein
MALADSIVGVESGGDPNARNARSSAAGAGQFLDGTWLDTLAKHRPDLTGTKEELLALRGDSQLSKDMTAAYAADNAGLLRSAGLPVTPGTQYLAHFAGPGGARGILNADPSTPAVDILGPRVIAANPFLQGKTAGDVAAWADRKMGGATAPAAARPAPPLSLAPPPAQPVQQAAPAAQQTPQVAQPAFAAAAPAAPIGAGDATPAPFALLPPRPRIDLKTIYANLRRG